MKRLVAILGLLVACTQEAAPTAAPDASWGSDARRVGEHFTRSHADLEALVPAAEWESAVARVAHRVEDLDRNEALVELMRLATMPARTGGGDGHSGIFPLDSHDRGLHLFPLRVYSFPDGLYVVDATKPYRSLVGERLVAIGGTPVDEAVALVEPLVPRDNAMTVAARLPQVLLTVEVLDGLGVVEGTGPAELSFDGGVSERVDPLPAAEYAEAMDVWNPMIPPSLPAGGSLPYLRAASKDWWSGYLADEDVVFVQYNRTLGDSFRLGRRVFRLVKGSAPAAVVVDLRHNPGGENAASAGLHEGLRHPAVRRLPLYVLVGRATFSAAGYLCLQLERDLDPVFAGEPTGFSTHFFGDPEAAFLENAGVTVNAGGVLWTEIRDGSLTEPLKPEIRVELDARDYFAGVDPVLDAVVDDLR